MSASIISRRHLVGLAVIFLAPLLIGGAVYGPSSWICVDVLVLHPILGAVFLAIPAVCLVLCVGLAVSPRVLQVNLLVFVGLWLLLEASFGMWHWAVEPAEWDRRETLSGQRYIPMLDAALGCRATPNTTEHHRDSHGGQPEFDVTYHFDRYGRRATPYSAQPKPSNFFLFLGDSNVMGEGLNEKQTLPCYAGQMATGYQPYNYGFSGWGPTQMLELLKSRQLPTQIDQRQGIACYLFIRHHLARVVGASDVTSDWGSDFPDYTLEGTDRLVRRGDFAHGWRFRSLFYYALETSPTASHFEVHLPIHYTEYDYRLTAQIIAESQRLLTEQFTLRKFFVIMAPGWDPDGDCDRVVACLTRLGVQCLDYRSLFDLGDLNYRVSEWNYHNSALANRRIAQRLATDLGIASEVTSSAAR